MGQLSCQSSRIPPILAPPCRCNTRYHLQSSILGAPKSGKSQRFPSWTLGPFGVPRVFGPKRRVCVVFTFGVFSIKKNSSFVTFLNDRMRLGSLKTPCLTLLRPLYQEVGWNSKKKRNPRKLWDFWSLKTCWFFGGSPGMGYDFPRQPGFSLCYGHYGHSVSGLPMPLDAL